jgi:uncharacterized protein (TIRG00374 family)
MTSERSAWLSCFGLGSIQKNNPQPSFIKNGLAVIKILVGLALLGLSIRGIQWGSLLSGIHSANLTWLALALLLVLLGLFLKVWRWTLLVKNYPIRSSLTRLYCAYFVGQAVNILMPFRGGELVRIGYFAGEPENIPDIVSTIALEKYLDLMALAVGAILVSYKFSLDKFLNLHGWLLPLAIMMSLLLLSAVLLGPAVWRKIRAGKLLPERITDWGDRWVKSSQWLRNPRQVLPGVCVTILIWGVMWITNLLLFRSLGMSLGGTAAGLVLISVYIGLLPALMPGNIGPFYFFAHLALLPFGIQNNMGFIFAVVLHAIVTLPPLLGGAIGILIQTDRVVT